MSMLEMATKLFLSKAGGNTGLDSGAVGSALQNLLPGASSGDLDIGQLVSLFSSGGLMAAATSWLGDGDNDLISGSNIIEALGADKIGAFASQLGMDENIASEGLAGMANKLF